MLNRAWLLVGDHRLGDADPLLRECVQLRGQSAQEILLEIWGKHYSGTA